jgi:predicted transcriptional regulator
MQNKDMKEYLKISESKAIDVLLWLLENRDSQNRISTTLETVASDCKVTKVTVNRVFQRLYQKEFLVKVRNGLYQLQRVYLRDKERYIFNKGYNTGLKDQRLPGEYKVIITASGSSQEYGFGDIQAAINFMEGCKNPESCYVNSFEFVQTYLDRDLDYLIPA